MNPKALTVFLCVMIKNIFFERKQKSDVGGGKPSKGEYTKFGESVRNWK